MTNPDAHPTRARRSLAWGVLASAGIAGLVLSACSSTPPHTDAAPKPKPTTTTTSTTAPPAPPCPLTGLPAPTGSVPPRPAMAVKIDNYPAGRPQSGLDKADIVFEEPVEGGITRYAAVFQCQDVPLIGPARSARNIDIGILGQLGNPLEAHVGGINPVIANIDASPIVNVDLGSSDSLMIHPAGKVPPDADYTSTALVYGTHPTMNTPPQPLFGYSDAPPAGGSPVAAVNIDFSGTSNVTWKWNAATNTFQRYYNGTTPDLLADNVQNQTPNVVVQYVPISYGPWTENSEGGLEVQADLYPDASGTAVIYRNGMAFPASWHRSTLGSPTQFVNAAGQSIPLQPGSTWVELVPNTIIATTTP
ncbi:MAG TPA: DUF3048 domain-containing protein [Acidimicrobiales bacterium]|jgi:hypothetical protein|nr:DUF3048 domain-containing protein [Acidimicrobiales bacterium]